MAEPAPLSGLRHTLRRRFGFHSLREGQEEVIRSILSGKDTLAIMPTGAGKSLCYQLPGLQLPGTTVVVSPLISLMKDQVDKLQEKGVDAAQLNSTLTPREQGEVLEEIAQQRSEFVFVTPERATQPGFLETLGGVEIDLFVVDEAHCISEWGHDFRPAYLALKGAIEALGNPVVLALTATATDRVVEDIARRLGREDLEVIDTGIYRENLHLGVVPMPDEEAKRAELARLLAETAGTGIVYVSTVRACEEVAAWLQGRGIAVARYHGRLGARERRASQDRFMAGELEAIVATNAFGMGIDKPDIRFVVHYNLPGSLESYYQEAGRAGRDGEPARCVLLYLPEDRNTQLFFINGGYPKPDHFVAVYRALDRLTAKGGEPTAEEVQSAIAGGAGAAGSGGGVARTKVRVILHAMEEMGLLGEAAEGTPGRLALRQRGLARAKLDELAHRYEARAEADRERLKRMVHYAQTALCRWKALLAYFGEEVEWERCGSCDNCQRPIDASAEPPPARQDLRPPTPQETVPLPPLVGPRSAAELRPGDAVTLPIYGRGEVEAVDGHELTIVFGGGERRRFRRE